ncbi:MAG: outer membrane lipoprotein-sorting protein [Proteobacteria bacterium]|nr:outer membrane lipoprotein-sorting protein [Pseudomonadota bacterium]
MKNLILIIFTLLLTPALSFALTADEIVEKSNLAYYYAGEDGSANLTMTITDRRGRERVREMTLLRKDIEDGGRQKFFVYFKKPADVKKMVFMVWKQVKGDDDRWLYLPAIDLVRRIASSDKRSSFAGGAFTYEDVSGRRSSDDTHELTGEEMLGERAVYVIKNTPKDPGSVEFAYFTARIDKETFLPVRGEYFDKNDKHIRTIEVLETKSIDGIPTVIKARAENITKGLKTVVEFNDVKYNIGIKESIFKERYLRKPPKEVR